MHDHPRPNEKQNAREEEYHKNYYEKIKQERGLVEVMNQ